MADISTKINTKSLRLQTRGSDYVETFQVTGLTETLGWNPWNAYAQPGIPTHYQTIEDFHSSDNIPPYMVGMFAKEITVDPMQNSTGGDYTIDVTWGFGDVGTLPIDRQNVTWTLGTVSQRITVDLNGHHIGSRTFFSSSFDSLPYMDEDADLAADVITPTVELEVQTPPRFGYYTPPPLMAAVEGRVNSTDFLIGGGATQGGVTIEPGYCLYLGGNIEQIGFGTPGKFVYYHRFMIASLDLPSGVPVVYSGTGLPYPDPVLPVKYGQWTAFRAIGVDKDGNEFELANPEQGQYIRREPIAIVVFEAYKDGGDFNGIFGIE